MKRKEKINSYIQSKNISILEIGALDSPSFRIKDYNIKYLDFQSTEELAKKGEINPRYKKENLVNVDFVCPTLNYSEYVSEKFDLIIANHVVEHVVNTVKWLAELRNLLNIGGQIFLSIPDKRYTFDIKRNTTTFVDVLKAYNNNLTKPDYYHILEHFYYFKEVSTVDIYDKKTLSKLNKNRFEPKEALKVAEKFSKMDYADVHCNVYTSSSFKEMIDVLIEIDLIEFELVEVTNPIKYSNEFYAILSKK